MVVRIIAVFLMIGVAVRELSYFKSRIIFTHKSVFERIAIVCGIALLIYIIARFAGSLINIAFGIVGIIALLAGWLKQGVTDKGILTLIRGAEFCPWEKIDSAKITEGETAEIKWLKENGAVIAKQQYSQGSLSDVREIMAEHEIREKIS